MPDTTLPQTMTPQQQQQLQQMFQLIAASRPQVPQSIPMLPGGGPTQPQLGGNNIQLPSGQASPGVPGVPMQAPNVAPSKTQSSGTMTISGIPAAVMMFKANSHQKQVEKVRAMTNQYIALKTDPNAQEQQQKLAQSDPKMAKLLEKQQQDFMKAAEKAITDPNSAEAQGIQKAYQDQEAKAQYTQKQRAELQDLMAQIRQRQTEAAKNEAMTPRTDEERAIAMGTKPSAEVQAQIDARREAQQETMQLRRDQLDQQYEIAKERMADQRLAEEDRRMYQQQMIQTRLAQIDAQMQIAQLRMEGKTKLPGSLVSRTEQAIQIREMIDDLQKKLQDPEVRKFIGPAKGMVAGVTKRFNAKFADFMGQYGALVAMQAIMHGYRGGAQMDKVFSQLLVGPAQTPEALEGVLNGISQLPDNFIDDMSKSYPNDPIWEGTKWAAGKSQTAAPVKGTGTEKDPIVVP